MKKLINIFEDVYDDLKITELRAGVRDGGSCFITFNDGFSCMYDHGFGTKSRDNFVKSWNDRTIISLEPRYLELIKQHPDFPYKNKI